MCYLYCLSFSLFTNIEHTHYNDFICVIPFVGFVYSKSLQIPEYIKMPADSIGCDCKGDCSSSTHCLCADRNGSDLPYVSRQKKVSAKHMDSTYKNVGR